MAKTPSPCIDVCKFKREGHCIGCSMTKPQKKMFKSLKKDDQREAFIEMLMAQQEVMGRYRHWAVAYDKKCRKKNAKLRVLEGGRAA
ncbi:DUF1289 domain-containing protein [Allosediminivita pacifica]|uniref:DUF1289 domain-containing protein n=1 Tax=Allosediminivita pacifica TaxID=1267769 RepID=A0A2T6APA1_9RHOB|nr:DUF1289 domain-containing protein [Allosediminivita pacifica]PTX45649.1 hypothetical protein C8N44_1203 [Allosediminivita pacifica]GGB06909.1 hypothetical protein GCM10011324_16270 [Allosediminivita pacifica]